VEKGISKRYLVYAARLSFKVGILQSAPLGALKKRLLYLRMRKGL
jgi:hypothetical protein